MSDVPGSNRPRSALADAAERMGQMARTVREQQVDNLRGGMRLPVSDVYSLSPDEVWSKKYMSQGIGPSPDCASPGGFCPMPFTVQERGFAPAAKPQAAAPVAVAAPAVSFAQIGQSIGKPARRSWFRRALRSTP